MTQPAKINDAHAQLLMSRLLDGELSPSDAGSLHAYLQANPAAADWMENLDTLRSFREGQAAAPERDAALARISEQVRREVEASRSAGKLARFPAFFAPLASAAAVAIVAGLVWIGFQTESAPSRPPEPAVVEFVATDIPDASTFIYSDEESGWTVVWVESGSGEDHG